MASIPGSDYHVSLFDHLARVSTEYVFWHGSSVARILLVVADSAQTVDAVGFCKRQAPREFGVLVWSVLGNTVNHGLVQP